ncbi:hypothetical protein [Actinomadura macrotermitis]|uniref:hypothetical protein n=1 Tax=Actinomadura macrotermitis TaxID=2585200 RepID=UPI0012954BF5|nr:hypothetical protein [Actinomadura macrotermitis]
MREVLTNVVLAQVRGLGGDVLAVTRTGWHETPAGRMYVSADGRARPTGEPVEIVDVPERLATAAAPAPALDGQADEEQVRAALDEVAGAGGWAPLLAIAAGARSFGQSLRPVPGALVIHGDPNTGKTCCAAAGRMLALAPSWPPLVTARFSDTPTDIEMKVDQEADMPTLIDDLALTRDASPMEHREAVTKLERLIRSVGNQEAVRGRRRRDLTAQESRFVRSIPVITAQTLPPGMQASLYRRAVVVGLVPGDADWRWWKGMQDSGDLAGRIAPALRAIGDRIIDRLAGSDEAAVLLADADRTGFAALRPYLDEALPGWETSETGMAGVADMAGAMLGGLVLAADAVGLDEAARDAILARVAGPLARALAVQAETMDDRRQASDDLRVAVGDIIRHALLARRAHLTGPDGTTTGAYGPDGLTPQDKGLREVGRDPVLGTVIHEGAGVALHHVPAYGGIAVRASGLHALIRASGDPRADGYTTASIGKALARAGALVQGRGVSHVRRVRLAGEDPGQWRLVIPADVIWPDLAGPASGPDDATPAGIGGPVEPSGPGEGTGPADDGQGAENRTEKGAGQADAYPNETGSAQVEGPRRIEAPGPVPAAASTSPGEADEAPNPVAEASPAPAASPASTPAAAWPVLAAGVDEHGVTWLGPDGASTTLDRGYESLPELLADVVEHMPAGGTIAISAPAAARLGYPDRPTNRRPGRASSGTPGKSRKAPPRAVTEGTAAGWTPSAAGIGAWTAWHGPDRPSVAVVIPEWINPREMRVSGETMIRAEHDALTAGYLLARYRELTGTQFVMTAGTSGTNMIRDAYPARSNRRRPFLNWRDIPEDCPAGQVQEQALVWDRPAELITADEHSMPAVIGFDAVAAYLSAMIHANLAWDRLEHTGVSAAGFDRNVPGYHLLAGPWRPLLDLPDLTGGPASGPRWVTTPVVDLCLAHDMPEEMILDAWLPPQVQDARGRARGRGARLLHGDPGVAERLRDALALIDPATGDPDEALVRQTIKATFRETYGMLRRGTAFVCRPDWADTIVGTARSILLRKVIAAAKGADGAPGRSPLRISTDCVFYAAPSADSAGASAILPAGWRLPEIGQAPKLGQWTVKPENVSTMAEFLATDAHGTPRKA